jgi:Protein of unknwon function (DUF3310)
MSDFFPGFEPTLTSQSTKTTEAVHDALVSIYRGEGLVPHSLESINVTSAKTVGAGNNNEGVNQLLPKYSNQAKQVGGDHYKQTTLQPWDVISAWSLDPWLANVVKYVQRHQRKNGREDLLKAVHYLEYVIDNYDLVKSKYYKE